MATSRRPKQTRPPAKRKSPAKRKAPARRKAAAPKKKAALRYAGVGNDAVQRATGKAWDEWLKLLDRAGAKKMKHKDIAMMLSRKFKVPDWWSQMVTVGYEQARGLRKLYEKAGGFSANASKTYAAPVGQLFNAWNDPDKRARWLLDAPIEVRRSTGDKSIRMTWKAGDSHVDVGFLPKGANKCQVSIEHSKLKDTAAVLRQKEFWKDALGRLQAMFEPVTPAIKL